MSAQGHISPQALSAQAGELSERERQEIERHASGCAECASMLRRAGEMMAVLRVALPPPDSRTAARQVLRALRSPPEPSRTRPVWRFASLSAAFALAAVAGGFYLVQSRSSPRVVSGQVESNGAIIVAGHAVALDRELATNAEAEVQLPQEGRVQMRAATRLVIKAKGRRLELARGAIDVQVTRRPGDHPFEVETPEIDIAVTGTRFTVERDDSSQRTHVAVLEGVVHLRSRPSGTDRDLRVGERWTEPPEAPKLEPKTEPPTPVAPVESPIVTAEARIPEVAPAEIRSRLKRGEIKKAKALLLAARSRAKSRLERAELDLIGAEILLAERKYALGIAEYLELSRRYPGTRQADIALFAAAQFSLEHAEAGVSAEKLLRRYLEEFPKGRFREDAERLLNALKHQ